METIILPNYEKDWHFASMQYGEYIGFNGNQEYAEIVEAILREPHDFLQLNITGREKSNLDYDIFNRSFRPSTNGIKYDWYIRFRGKDKKDILTFIIDVFIHAMIFNYFIKQERIMNHKILESLPSVMEEYSFAIIDSHGNKASEEIPLDALGSYKIEINKMSLSGSYNELSEENIAKKVIELLKKSTTLNETQDNAQPKEELENLENKIIDLTNLTEDLRENISSLLNENDNFRKQIKQLNLINGKIKDSQLLSKKNIFRSFASIYRGFYFPKGIENFYKAFTAHDYELHLNDLRNHHQALVIDKKSIDDINTLVKIEGMNTWHKPKSRKDGGFMISYINNFGNDAFYIYFSEDLKTDEDWYYLENNDPPRDNFEKILTSSRPLS